ncbi:signal peptide prediction [Magnetococcus marinus MC-1]|uniref:Signal peptide prediction n=1 Tax=Magnetococcus marinus (strain ATCC BAA-1437 / JCM 17883 / MC-1) TaxID=156889 RepID=A0L6Y4_MAGMM|nr:substrate-binding domain-containing protein [Magnetococcus marinus]ABK43727.1 signal peptide prediction [Magnetococcus marinus MC-1]
MPELPTPQQSPSDLSRRRFLQGTAATAASGVLGAPYVQAAKPVLRVLGTHVTLREPIRKQAEADLGFAIEFHPGGSARVQQRAASRPESFDIYEQWSNSMNILWRTQAIQPLDIRRINYWHEINDLSKTGRLTAEANLGLGDAPYTLLYVQADGTLGAKPTAQISFLPYVHNVDAFGYDTRTIPKGRAYETESWGWLLDERWRGRVAIVNEPTIGLFDLALAVQAKGMMQFADIGNMTEQEVDQLFNILITYKRNGHFSGFWNSVPESAEMIASGQAVIASMFSPAVADLNEQGIPAAYAAPKEGYRAWHGVMCLSSQTRGRVEDMAYAYMNWWLSGWPGAFVARQGYYISNPQRSRPLLSPAEWNYWYEGKPASEDLLGPEGHVAVRKGSVRNGGSYWHRFSHVAVWNTVMNTYEYSLPRWHEFLLS